MRERKGKEKEEEEDQIDKSWSVFGLLHVE